MAQQAQALAQEQQSKGSSADAASASAEAGPQEQLPQGDEGEGEEGVDKALLQQCAEMIKELNDNLTQVCVDGRGWRLAGWDG